MYQPIYIKIQNVGSIKDLDYNFKLNKSQLIQGINLDNKGQRNNGVGKSSFIDAIGFSITGLSLRNLNTDEFIRDNENEAYIEILLRSKDSLRELLIKRTLYRKKSQQIEIFLNNEEQHSNLPDVNSRNDFIINEIGISKEDLFQFFLITKDRYKPYFKLSDTDKKSITGRFSNSDVIDNVFQYIDIDINSETSVKSNLESKIIAENTKINTYQREIDNLKDQVSVEYKAKLLKEYTDLLENEISEKEIICQNVIEFTKSNDLLSLKYNTMTNKLFKNEYFLNLDERCDNLSFSLKNKESNFDKSITSLRDSIKQYDKSINNFKFEISQLNTVVNDLTKTFNNNNNVLQSSISCPKCEHEFVLSKNVDLSKIKKDQIYITETIDLINIEIKSWREKIENTEVLISEKNQQISDKTHEFDNSIKDIKAELFLIKSEIEASQKYNKKINDDLREVDLLINTNKVNKIKLENSIILKDESILLLQDQIDNIDQINNSEAIKRYLTLIDKSQEELINLTNKLNESENKLQNYKNWVLKFKSFKSYLANQSLKNVEDLINYYLDKMNTDISVEINGFSQKGKVIREKITEIILRDGLPIGSYGRFSGGERGRIDMGSILANQTLINNNASPRGLDFILIDEILESLDAQGIEGIIKALDNVDKTLILISQNEINTLQDQTITFVKQNGKTKIQN